MYIVYFNGAEKRGKRHSAWDTFEEANSQAGVLKDHGYKMIHIVYDETIQTDNGHYYV